MVILLRPSHVLNEMQDFIRCIRILLGEAHLMAADSYKPEGFKSAVLGREQIRPKVKVVLSFRVAGDAARLYELSFGQMLIHEPGPLQNCVGLKIPRVHISGCGRLEKSLEGRTVQVGVVTRPTPHANDAVEKIEVGREVVPKIIVTQVVCGGRISQLINFPVSSPFAARGNGGGESLQHVEISRIQAQRPCTTGPVVWCEKSSIQNELRPGSAASYHGPTGSEPS